MNVALLGHGTVGRGVVEIIETRVPSLAVTRILELPDRCSEPRMTANYDDILTDDSIEAVVECMGGLEPAHTFIMSALKAGKSVVTSNKAVVAEYFEEFVDAAAEGGSRLFIEATCGGGIPWIASIIKARRIDDVTSFSGILNGTTNYIIDQMSKNGLEFADVLKHAQELGYAEANPSADIDGIDVKNKTIITASVAFDVACTHDLPVTGIRNLTKADMDTFAAHGLSVKLLARGISSHGRYAVAVEPMLLDVRSVEACIPDNFNIATFEGTTVGQLKFYGQGAGSLPTGNAMVQDLLDLAAGADPAYDFSRGLEYDPSLLEADYVFRCTGTVPEGSEGLDQGYYRVNGITAARAREILDDVLTADPQAFMAAIPQEG